MVTRTSFDVHADEVAVICREVGVKRLELVGRATGDFDAGSDEPDFLVEFLPGAEQPWMAEYTRLIERLSDLYGLRVHLIATGSPYYSEYRERIDAARTPVYEA